MPKDRLAALKRACSHLRGDDEDEDDDTVFFVHRTGFMEDFFELTDEIRSAIGEIEDNVKEVRLKHSTLLSTPQSDDSTQKELDDLMLVIKRTATGVRGKLKAIEQSIQDEEEEKPSSVAGLRIRQLQFRTLSQKFNDVMKSYMACQVEYQGSCKHRFQRQLEIMGKTVTDEQLEQMMESDNPAIFTQDILMETEQARHSLKDIETRHSDIVKMEHSIRELHDMFSFMAVTVEDQGCMLNRIEDNVVSAEEHVQSANTNVRKAVKYQSKARRKKLLLLSIPLAVILVVVIVVVLWLATT